MKVDFNIKIDEIIIRYDTSNDKWPLKIEYIFSCEHDNKIEKKIGTIDFKEKDDVAILKNLFYGKNDKSLSSYLKNAKQKMMNHVDEIFSVREIQNEFKGLFGKQENDIKI